MSPPAARAHTVPRIRPDALARVLGPRLLGTELARRIPEPPAAAPERPARLRDRIRSSAARVADGLPDRVRQQASRAVGLVSDVATSSGRAITERALQRALQPSALTRAGLDRLQTLADVAATRMLALDEAASQLAMVVEDAAQRHPREQLTGILLRRNLLLNGVFLHLLEPMLQGQQALVMDAPTATRARDTLISLLADLAGLDGVGGPERDRLDALAARFSLDQVLPHLDGQTDDEAFARFCVLSYSLFLQSWMVRAAVQSVAVLLDAAAPLDTDPVARGDDVIDVLPPAERLPTDRS